MPTCKKPSELVVGDVFELPESEEEFHGMVPRPEVVEKYWIHEIQPLGKFHTATLCKRESDGFFQEVIFVPWVTIIVIENRPILKEDE